MSQAAIVVLDCWLLKNLLLTRRGYWLPASVVYFLAAVVSLLVAVDQGRRLRRDRRAGRRKADDRAGESDGPADGVGQVDGVEGHVG